MDGISSSIAQWSMAAASARVSNEVQTSMMKNVMALQEDMMSQLLQSLGVGGSLDVRG
ncbi:MAG: putative motility protein [Synergistaceae bacterium]|nr:putative motility protein [Synergistaceae bacterium]